VSGAEEKKKREEGRERRCSPFFLFFSAPLKVDGVTHVQAAQVGDAQGLVHHVKSGDVAGRGDDLRREWGCERKRKEEEVARPPAPAAPLSSLSPLLSHHLSHRQARPVDGDAGPDGHARQGAGREGDAQGGGARGPAVDGGDGGDALDDALRRKRGERKK
jgi:hypothetical protein